VRQGLADLLIPEEVVVAQVKVALLVVKVATAAQA
jgi:hypothetical protein